MYITVYSPGRSVFIFDELDNFILAQSTDLISFSFYSVAALGPFVLKTVFGLLFSPFNSIFNYIRNKKIEYKDFKKYSKAEIYNITRSEALAALTSSGIWPSFIQRPFGVVANPLDEPSAIYISAFDSSPCAPDMAYIMRGKEEVFQLGIEVLNKLVNGNIHLNLDSTEIPSVFSGIEHVETHKFSGPHPAGNVGVQIHHIKPIGKNDKVWTIDPLSVARIGTLFFEGIYDASKMVAITGSEVIHPHYVKTYSGACLDKLLDNNVKKANIRYISGNVLTGEHVGARGYLGHFDNQISVIPEGDKEEFLGWMLPSFKKLSFHRAFGLLSFLNPKKEKVLDTNTCLLYTSDAADE